MFHSCENFTSTGGLRIMFPITKRICCPIAQTRSGGRPNLCCVSLNPAPFCASVSHGAACDFQTRPISTCKCLLFTCRSPKPFCGLNTWPRSLLLIPLTPISRSPVHTYTALVWVSIRAHEKRVEQAQSSQLPALKGWARAFLPS